MGSVDAAPPRAVRPRREVPEGLPLVYLLIGLLVLFPALLGVSRTLFSRHWRSVPGRIESLTAEGPSTGLSGDYYVTVTYHYTLDGRTLLGSGVNLDSRGQVSRSGYEALLSRYPVGKSVRVYINPDDPYQTVLEFDPGMPTLVLLFLGLAFCAVGLGCVLFYVTPVPTDSHDGV